MRFTVRTFLCSIIPLTLLVAVSLWMVERAVIAEVQDALRNTLRNHQVSIGELQARNEQQNRRYLRLLGDSTALKASLRLMLDYPGDAAARATLEDQLREICAAAEIDIVVVGSVTGVPLAGVLREDGALRSLDTARTKPPLRGLFLHGRSKYQMTSVPLDQGDERVAIVAVGEQLDFGRFHTPVVLLQHGRVLESSLPGVSAVDLQGAMSRCNPNAECELRLPRSTYLSLATKNVDFGRGYTLRSLIDVNSSLKPIQTVLRKLFVMSGGAAIAAAVFMTAFSSWSIVRPISRVIAHLRESEQSGRLREFDTALSGVKEVQELMRTFNHTASAMHLAEQNLHVAYVEFVGSLANALDARDPYTAGHSSRVANYSCAIAEELGFTAERVADLRTGALLHDIGKIGVSDEVLRKPGRLTDEEFRQIKDHPQIGRRILEGVNGFAPYLDIVELHHENWDGTGYPHGLSGAEVPLTARIVHVADAYDAMTSDRPYRKGMTVEAAMAILRQYAGTQFDPQVVKIFARQIAVTERDPDDTGTGSLEHLARKLSGETATSRRA